MESGGLRAGETVLVHGTGGVVVTGSEDKREQARALDHLERGAFGKIVVTL